MAPPEPSDAVRRLIERLALVPHPEGGWYRETHRSERQVAREGLPPEYGGARSMVTSILYLLPAEHASAWHRVRSEELWFHHAGDGVRLHVSADWRTGASRTAEVGPGTEHVLQAVVPAAWWQRAEALEGPKGFALLGCVVAPGFEFEDFEIARETADEAETAS